jgi:cob(I)alamin adenosyltransferase
MARQERRGLVMVFTGPGKGKTTAALGAALRAAGAGLSVRIIQFIKSGQGYGELAALARLPGVKLTAHGLGLIKADPDLAPHRAAAEAALGEARRELAGGAWDMIILDEVCVALAKGLVELAQVLDLLRSRPPETHLILTGRDCPAELIAAADTVTEMREVKHHLAAGITAQAGVEY